MYIQTHVDKHTHKHSHTDSEVKALELINRVSEASPYTKE